jgi:hypothetical protein
VSVQADVNFAGDAKLIDTMKRTDTAATSLDVTLDLMPDFPPPLKSIPGIYVLPAIESPASVHADGPRVKSRQHAERPRTQSAPPSTSHRKARRIDKNDDNLKIGTLKIVDALLQSERAMKRQELTDATRIGRTKIYEFLGVLREEDPPRVLMIKDGRGAFYVHVKHAHKYEERDRTRSALERDIIKTTKFILKDMKECDYRDPEKAGARLAARSSVLYELVEKLRCD